ncbi:MAG: hypothetical protein WCO33_01690 [bacterium]
MSKIKSTKAKTLTKKTDQKPNKSDQKPIKTDDEEVIVPVSGSDDFIDADEEGDSDDLTATFAKRKALADDDSWDVVSTDEDDDVLTIKSLANDLTDEEQLDAVISDYAGIDGLAPEKSNKED